MPDWQTCKTWLTDNEGWLGALAAFLSIVAFVWIVLKTCGRRVWEIIRSVLQRSAAGGRKPQPRVEPAVSHRPRHVSLIEFWRRSYSLAAAAACWLAAWIKYLLPRLNYQIRESTPSSNPNDFRQMEHSTEWFSNRFADAFPGVREPIEFTNTREIAHRLGILLRAPLCAKMGMDGCHPAWWTRGGYDMHISQWYHLKPNIFLMDSHELRISRIVAIPGRAYWQNSVYVECRPHNATGIYGYSLEDIQAQLEAFQFASEEFGLYNFRAYSLQEYEDGAYSRRGRVRRFRHPASRRTRYLTAFNFLIVANVSPVQAQSTREDLRGLLNGCLDQTSTPFQLANWLKTLPRNALDR